MSKKKQKKQERGQMYAIFRKIKGKWKCGYQAHRFPTKKDAQHHLRNLRAFNPGIKARIGKIAKCRSKQNRGRL